MSEPTDARGAGESTASVKADANQRLPDELSHPFSFERARRSLRSLVAARPQVLVLLGRLGVPEPAKALVADPALERRLLVYGTEVLLNIEYYYARSRREERKQWAMNVGFYGLSLAFVGFAIWVFVHDRVAAVATVSQIAAACGAVLAGAKFVTEGQDFQKTRCSFWEAGAELKERLYLFISDWCGRAWDGEQRAFSPEFVLALQAEIGKARDIQVAERRRFYDLMAAPTRLLGATQQLTGEVPAAMSAYVQAAAARAEQRRQYDLEQLDKQRADLVELYPDEGERPSAVRARLDELEARARRLGGGVSAATSVAVADGGGGVVPPDEPGVVSGIRP